MKKVYLFLSAFILPAFIALIAFTGGAPVGHTGSPLDGVSCTDCHTDEPATDVDDWITTNIPAVGYTAGETYTITLTTPDIETVKIGFQITSETATVKTGTWTITDETRTQLATSSAVTHTAAGTAPSGNPNSWTVDWTAPVEGTGDVTFYAAVNNANDNGSNSGDKIYVTSLETKESTVGLAELFDQSISNVYPNPAVSNVNLQVPAQSEIQILDNSGRLISSTTAASELFQTNVSNLDNGIYYIRIQKEGQATTRTFIKR